MWRLIKQRHQVINVCHSRHIAIDRGHSPVLCDDVSIGNSRHDIGGESLSAAIEKRKASSIIIKRIGSNNIQHRRGENGIGDVAPCALRITRTRHPRVRRKVLS